jgi:hypothetical protein
MLLQAIPVLHFFSSQKEIFYALIDEEKPEEKANEKKEYRECVSLSSIVPPEEKDVHLFSLFAIHHYTSPLLELMTPPPDAC